MTKTILRKIIVVLVSAGVGLAAGTAAGTAVIAALNYRATDGPYFPASAVALGFLALPIGVLLLPIQSAAVAYETIARRNLGNSLLVLGPIAGLATGVIWYLVLTSARFSPGMLFALCGLGVVQALSVLGGHWIAYKLKFAAFDQK